MSLSSKLVLITVVVMGLFVGFAALVQRYVIYPTFIELDRDEAEENGKRSLQALEREMHHLGVLNQDWSNWDDTYHYIENKNQAYEISNLTETLSTTLKLNALFFYNRAGNLVWGNYINEDKEFVSWPTFPVNRSNHPLLFHKSAGHGHSGVLLTDYGVMLVASFPIVTSEGKGPVRGSLIMGRALDDNLLKVLQEQTGVKFQVWELGQEPSQVERDVVKELMQQQSGRMLSVEEHWVHFYALIKDVEGQVALLLRADTPREISAHGRHAIWIGGLFQGLSVLIVMVVMMVFLHQIVLKPIVALTRKIKQGDLSGLVPVERAGDQDEIGFLGHYKTSLEQAIVEKTRELQDARDIALGASKAKGEFLAVMSHEIRTPMNAILGFSEILDQTALSKEQKQYLTAIRSAGNALLGLINDILDLSKVESGKLIVERIPFGLSSLLDECHELFFRAAQDKGLNFVCEVSDELPERLLGDRVRIRQVLANLLGNAIKFTAEGRVSLRVREEVRSQRVVVLTFSVEDTGIGIPAEKLQTIFEPFIQANASTTRNYGGSGLGLAICVRMAEAMGGTVWAENAPWGGSLFYLTLPFLMDGTESLKPVGVAETIGPVEPVLLGKLRVLVVDDVEDNRHLLQAMLEFDGHQVEFATHGQEAVDRFFCGHEFDVILMDIQMPVMDGYEATRVIRGLEKSQGVAPIPIIALTAHAVAGESERCLEAGCDLFLSKPIKKERLMNEISRLLKSVGAR